jgi:hypothetical protein
MDESLDTQVSAEQELTLTLRKPVKLGDVEYGHLELREPNAKQLAEACKAGNDVEVAIALISMVAKVPRAAVGQLCQRDFKEASDFFGRFNEVSRGTGAISLPS